MDSLLEKITVVVRGPLVGVRLHLCIACNSR